MALIERELLAKIESMTPEQFYGLIMAVCGAYLRQDAAPVVHEKWAWREEWDSHHETHSCDLISCGWYCTGCGIELGKYLTKVTGQTVILDDDFCKPKLTRCPNCGARMGGGEGHETD